MIGKPDPVAMEVVKAFVSLKEGYEPTDQLRREMTQALGGDPSGAASPGQRQPGGAPGEHERAARKAVAARILMARF